MDGYHVPSRRCQRDILPPKARLQQVEKRQKSEAFEAVIDFIARVREEEQAHDDSPTFLSARDGLQ